MGEDECKIIFFKLIQYNQPTDITAAAAPMCISYLLK